MKATEKSLYSENIIKFYLFEAVHIELSNKGVHFLMFEVVGENLL